MFTYCDTCKVLHLGECPKATRAGSIPNPYATVDTKPEPTERQKALWRAIEQVCRS